MSRLVWGAIRPALLHGNQELSRVGDRASELDVGLLGGILRVVSNVGCQTEAAVAESDFPLPSLAQSSSSVAGGARAEHVGQGGVGEGLSD